MYFQKIQTTLLKQHYQTPLKLQTSYLYIYIYIYKKEVHSTLVILLTKLDKWNPYKSGIKLKGPK